MIHMSGIDCDLHVYGLVIFHCDNGYTTLPGEKDHANTWLVRGLVGTSRISADIREILTVQCPVTPKRAGASGSRINDDGVSTLKQGCSRQYSGSLKLSSRRFERTQSRSAPS